MRMFRIIKKIFKQPDWKKIASSPDSGNLSDTRVDRYWQYRTCKSCGFEEQRQNDKFVAAFESTRKWDTDCPNCGEKDVDRAGWAIPGLDDELLHLWGQDESLSFSDQDEDILLANEDNIELLLEGIESSNLLLSKRSILLAALCVLIYDHTPIDEEDDPEMKLELSAKLISELKSRIHLFHELDTVYISDYIKEVVYPRLGLSLASN